MDLEGCKGLNEMNERYHDEIVFDRWKRIAHVKLKMEEEIERLKAETVFLRSELEEERKMQGLKGRWLGRRPGLPGQVGLKPPTHLHLASGGAEEVTLPPTLIVNRKNIDVSPLENAVVCPQVKC
ncbi:hypothetical protein FHG87_018766 [Trinorchestia longiramus]|nr:hypothetical protein FHG87_018766 [Trinorchestia longiramus]